MAKRSSDELTDEQWAIIGPLLPEPPRRNDGKGRPRRENREVLNGILFSTASYGYCEAEHDGKICQSVSHHTRLATDDLDNRPKTALCAKCSKP